MIFKTKDGEEEIVSCENCACLIKKEDAQIIENRYNFFCEPLSRYFCQKCKKPYSLIKFGKYYKQIEVDEQGEPIGYIKKNK